MAAPPDFLSLSLEELSRPQPARGPPPPPPPQSRPPPPPPPSRSPVPPKQKKPASERTPFDSDSDDDSAHPRPLAYVRSSPPPPPPSQAPRVEMYNMDDFFSDIAPAAPAPVPTSSNGAQYNAAHSVDDVEDGGGDDDDDVDEAEVNRHRRRRRRSVIKAMKVNAAGNIADVEDDDEPTVAEERAATDPVDDDDAEIEFFELQLNEADDSDSDNGDGDDDDEERAGQRPKKATTAEESAQWLEEQLSLREDEYTTERSLRVFLGSWNVNAKKQDKEPDISSWLFPPIPDADGNVDPDEEKSVRACDIYAVGFQEIVDLSAANLIADHTASKPWQDRILATLHRFSGSRYEVCATVQLVGLSLSVFVRDTYVSHVHDIRVATVGTGIMGVGGNKGACLVRFDVFKSSVCIVNSHLAAHQNRQHARNRDYHTIMRRALLTRQDVSRKRPPYTNPSNKLKLVPNDAAAEVDDEDDSLYDEEVASAQATAASAQIPSPTNASKTTQQSFAHKFSGFAAAAKAGFNQLKQHANRIIQEQMNAMELNSAREEQIKDGLRIYEHDHIWWIGDLNYRLNVKDMNDTDLLIRQRKFKHLRQVDQLIIEKKHKRAFAGFNEGKIKFAPTYKYESGTNNYDRRDPKKARFPAWCDRIQWCSISDDDIDLLFYNRAELTMSDHKPVMAVFAVPMKKDVKKKKEKLLARLQALAADDRKRMPRVAFNTDAIEIGDVKFEGPVVRTLIMKNIGKAVVRFRCESPGMAGKKRSLMPWLSVDPAEGILHPDQVLHLTITVLVDRNSAYQLNSGDDSLQTFLVIRLTEQHRAEIALKGRYMKSCLGSDINWLMSLQSSVRGGDDSRTRVEGRPTVPFELYRLVDYLILNGATTAKKAFRPLAYAPSQASDSGKPYETPLIGREELFIIECLDTGRPFVKLPVHHYVQALLYFLTSLHKPVFFKRTKSLAQMNVKEREKFKKDREAMELSGQGVRLNEWCLSAMMSMPKDHYDAFRFVMGFLREVVKNEATNNYSAEFVAVCVADCITQRPANEPYSDEITYSPVNIIEHILTNIEYDRKSP